VSSLSGRGISLALGDTMFPLCGGELVTFKDVWTAGGDRATLVAAAAESAAEISAPTAAMTCAAEVASVGEEILGSTEAMQIRQQKTPYLRSIDLVRHPALLRAVDAAISPLRLMARRPRHFLFAGNQGDSTGLHWDDSDVVITAIEGRKQVGMRSSARGAGEE